MPIPENVMPDREQIVQQQDRLTLFRRRLAYQIQQQAHLGVIAPFSLVEDISNAREEIQRLKEQLRAWGVAVDDRPDDEPSQPGVEPAFAARQAELWLSAIGDLLGAPGVRATLEGFRESFEIICRQIDRLGHYKDLHDLLHDLQFNCYNPIVRGGHDFPNNPLFLESLADYAAELQEIVNSLWEVVERANLDTNEQTWIRQLGHASELLRASIDELGKEQLDRTTFQIGRVLYIHPSRINERLKDAARDLPLSSLLKAMTAVRQHSNDTAIAPETLEQLDRGIAALDKLGQSLSRLIVEHDAWQEIDLELHRVEENLAQHISELEWLWPDLKARIDPLCEGHSDRWTQDLRHTIARIEGALATRDLAKITAGFRPFRRQVGLCFFQADKKLKELCRTLRQVDGPLNSVMSMIA